MTMAMMSTSNTLRQIRVRVVLTVNGAVGMALGCLGQHRDRPPATFDNSRRDKSSRREDKRKKVRREAHLGNRRIEGVRNAFGLGRILHETEVERKEKRGTAEVVWPVDDVDAYIVHGPARILSGRFQKEYNAAQPRR